MARRYCALTADFHNDVLTALNKQSLLKEYAAGKNEIVCAYFKGKRTFADAYSACKEFNSFRRSQEKPCGLYLAFEDFSYSKNISALQALLSFSPVYVTLTWNHANILGGGAYSTEGLTEYGGAVIKLMNERNVSLDLAHANEKTFFGSIDLSKSPVCSHACFYDVCPHPRNLKREQIRALIERQGLIGLCFYPPFLSESAKCGEPIQSVGIYDVVKHIDYFCERFSPENLCIGSDINGCERYLQGFEDYGFERELKIALKKNGYDKKTVDGFFYDNLKKFLSNKRLY